MIKLKTLLYLIPRYQLIEVTYNRINKPQIKEKKNIEKRIFKSS